MVLYAKDIVETEFLSMPRDLEVLAAAKAMKERRHGFVVVVSSVGRPEGIVTEWDLLARVVAEERDAAKVTLGDIMTPDLVYVDANDGIDKVAQIMAEKGIRRVLVLGKGQVVGVITAKTILVRLKDYVDNISSLIAGAHAPPY